MSSWAAMCASLRSSWTDAEKTERSAALLSLEIKLGNLEELAQSGQALNFQALELARSLASNTLIYRQEEKHCWNKALADAGESLNLGKILDFAMIRNWNQILRNDFSEPCLRNTEQYLVKRQLLPFVEINEALLDFENCILKNENDDPITKASIIYQWLISIHPFPNGNGRTARLAADYILLQNGLLPVVFPTPLSSAVALFPDRPQQIRPIEAFRQIVLGIQRSIEILSLQN